MLCRWRFGNTADFKNTSPKTEPFSISQLPTGESTKRGLRLPYFVVFAPQAGLIVSPLYPTACSEFTSSVEVGINQLHPAAQQAGLLAMTQPF
jgi:hypothetical protein